MTEDTYLQAPYQRVTREHWEQLRSQVRPVAWDELYADEALPEAEGENFCSSDVCEIPR
jgi:hypothetical protein